MAIAEELSPDDLQEFLQDEIQSIAHLPFSTAIRHTLSKSRAV
jgi:hypothetical protein